jgi:predicted DNA-binding transcriptional regulator AlpA
MQQIIVATQDELNLIVTNAVSKAISAAIGVIKPKEPEVKKKLSFPEAVSFLKEIGYGIGKSQLYKKTMDNTVPCERFGRKIVFDRDRLQAWAENRAKNNREENPVTASVAESAKRKLKRS